MPNRDVHGPVGAVSGGACALHELWAVAVACGRGDSRGAVGGFAGGVLPDEIDTPEHPRHRAEAHSMALTGTIGWILKENLPEWQSALRAQAEQFAMMRAQSESPLLQILFWLAEYFCRFLTGLIAGVLAGYASHLTLDFFTPMSLPVL
jgi:hypothetical protein